MLQKFDMTPLVTRDASNDDNTVKETFEEHTPAKAVSEWPSECIAKEKWTVMMEALLDSATDCLGILTRHHPGWLKECAANPHLFLTVCNKTYAKWLATRKNTDYAYFKKTTTSKEGRCPYAVRY